jgi:hypothetical protein
MATKSMRVGTGLKGIEITALAKQQTQIRIEAFL